MTLAVKDHISFYSSPDLKDWAFESDFGMGRGAHDGVWECPDLFPLKVGGTEQEKWVLLVSINPGAYNGGSGTQYFVGEFDGSEFTSDNDSILWLDYGRDNYAGVTWSNVPNADGRTLFMGWMSNWDYAQVVPTEKWRSAMTIPRELTLLENDGLYIVKSTPIVELKDIIGKPQELTGLNMSHVIGASTYVLNLNLSNLTSSCRLEFSNSEENKVEIVLDPITETISFDRDESGKNDFSDQFNGIQSLPWRYSADSVRLEVYVDESSMELFIDDGRVSISNLIFPNAPLNTVRINSDQAQTRIDAFYWRPISSAW